METNSTEKKWTHPLEKLQDNKNIFRTGLKVYNSLTNKKEEFITKDGSRTVRWYTCGPTVYDAAHLGHARTYVSFDIIRRIMSSYFKYDVKLCMNITDIDDKIIIRSNEQNIEFSQFAKIWENDFFKDMMNLNVMYPTYITRVSEYVTEIIDFIKVLIDKKYAYESNGSVYFDIENFTKNSHTYAKLDPSKLLNPTGPVDLDEGALSKGTEKDKKNSGDFVLWKKSKEKEPFWDSPWGKGRPGWHIECSCMCSEIFGDSLDMHAGGCDLKFPHHDNEIAQTEAYYDNKQWINYFLHTGHLNIEGLKMSKSLKNFKKISDFITVYSANSFRLFFCTSKWDNDMDFTEDSLKEAADKDKYMMEFFQNVKVWSRENDLKKNLKFDENDKALLDILFEKQTAIHENLCDNFNTPQVIKNLISIISKTYEYEKKTRGTSFKIFLIFNLAQYIAFITKSLGLIYKTEFIEYFIKSSDEGSRENFVTPYVDVITKFRDAIKTIASTEKDYIKILKKCDELRDEVMPALGVKIEDRGKGVASIFKLYNPEDLLKEIQKEKEKIVNELKEKELKAKEKEFKLSTPAKEFYAIQTDLYSKFDADGVPTHDAKGTEITKEIKNKLKKEFKKHEDNHKKWLETKNKQANPDDVAEKRIINQTQI